MRIKVRQPAGEHEQFARSCFDVSIGQRVPLTIDGVRLTDAVLASAEVLPGGAAVDLAFDLPDDTQPWIEEAAHPGRLAPVKYSAAGLDLNLRVYPHDGA